MELDFKNLEEYLQDYMNSTLPDFNLIDSEGRHKEYKGASLRHDLAIVTPQQRLGFIEKYMEFISPKQLRRGTSTASADKDFNIVEAK